MQQFEFTTFTGRQYLQMDIAGRFGHDDILWEKRLEWFKENKNHLHSLVPKAAEPALFYAAVRAMEAVERGEPIGYTISLDATSSGLQILSCLTGDRLAAEISNVVNRGEEHRSKAYKEIFEEMKRRLGSSVELDYEKVKRAVMTSLYGSKAEPKEVFGEGELLTTFYAVMKDRAPAAWELNEYFLEIWDPKALSYDWVLPDNFHAHITVKDKVKEEIRFLDRAYEISREVNQPIEQGRSLSANSVHS